MSAPTAESESAAFEDVPLDSLDKEPQKPEPSLKSKVVFIAMAFLAILALTVAAFLLISSITSQEISNPNTPEFFPHSSGEKARLRRLVEEINAMNLTWKAEYNHLAAIKAKPQTVYEADYSSLKLDGLSVDESKSRQILQDTESHLRELAKNYLKLPTSFDARERWSRCPTVHHIQDQGACGSCWAASSTSSISDRLCISSNFTKQYLLSTQDLLACCDFCGRCQGTQNVMFPYLYWKKHGIVSGGSFGSNEGCRPYEIDSTCGHPCPAYFAQAKFNPKCEKRCQPLFDGVFETDLGRASSVYFVRMSDHMEHWTLTKFAYNKYKETMNAHNVSSIELIKREIFLHGPVTMCTMVQEQFMHYRSGIYTLAKTVTYEREAQAYGHCLKILGWGAEKGVEYWTVANSWGRHWGENGFGRISMQYNFAGTSVAAGLW